MSVLELHPELTEYVGEKYGKWIIPFILRRPRLLSIGESHYLPDDKSYSEKDWYEKSSEALGLSKDEKDFTTTSKIINNDVINSSVANPSHSIYRFVGNAYSKKGYKEGLKNIVFTNYYKRPAEKKGGSINNTKLDNDVAFDELMALIKRRKPDIISFQTKKGAENFRKTAIERNNLEAIKIAEKAVVTSHPASPHHHKDKEILPKALKDYYLKAICFAFLKMSIILTVLLFAFLLFRNCSFESQQEPTVKTVVETKVAEPTKEIWNTEKVTAIKSSLNGCETLTNVANFKTEWEKNLENAKINEAKQIVIPSVGVLFELGSSVVSEEGRKLIQEFASAYLQTNKEATVLIESYTCDIGTDENNMTLSNDRANVIKAVLENMGVTSVEVKSYGESTYNDLNCKSKEEHRRGNISVK